MSLVHKFIQNGEYYILDVNTGAVHIVDELVYDLLDEDTLKSKEELIELFKDKYSIEEIIEVYNEIMELKEEGFLYSEDTYEEIAIKGQDSKDFIKALCLNITHDCNLRCKYCFADEGKYHGAR
ncbi:MAG: thioether cross-link-forming SCIFF peptide maturase, partial [Clostridium sp.]|nr:thioether cross-link-forming SCIFF peptide maturase [Clostridium sp.]